ncbi:hypothetical protein NAEX_01172 [Nannocystis exedens]|nr:hypothetical protein NAEX_01172 [Nannocystis exedens]
MLAPTLPRLLIPSIRRPLPPQPPLPGAARPAVAPPAPARVAHPRRAPARSTAQRDPPRLPRLVRLSIDDTSVPVPVADPTVLWQPSRDLSLRQCRWGRLLGDAGERQLLIPASPFFFPAPPRYPASPRGANLRTRLRPGYARPEILVIWPTSLRPVEFLPKPFRRLAAGFTQIEIVADTPQAVRADRRRILRVVRPASRGRPRRLAARRSPDLRHQPEGRAAALPGRRPSAPPQQHLRARAAARGGRSQKLALRRQRRRRPRQHALRVPAG